MQQAGEAREAARDIVHYLDAVREVFSDAPKEHTDLVPEQIDMGPYDWAYKRHVEAGYRPAQ